MYIVIFKNYNGKSFNNCYEFETKEDAKEFLSRDHLLFDLEHGVKMYKVAHEVELRKNEVPFKGLAIKDE